MADKNDVEVVIGGKVFTLSGYESEEYLQKLASHVSGRLAELNADRDFRKQPSDTRVNMVYLNLADDYFKAKKIADSLQEDIDAKDKEIYDLKHELITDQIQLDTRQKELKDLKAEVARCQKQIARLEDEIGKTGGKQRT
ncbi:MAG: cell division protein ZapA [Lachnospira sp.]|nr:cell division protein ZapA [Lachnospira sp.]